MPSPNCCIEITTRSQVLDMYVHRYIIYGKPQLAKNAHKRAAPQQITLKPARRAFQTFQKFDASMWGLTRQPAITILIQASLQKKVSIPAQSLSPCARNKKKCKQLLTGGTNSNYNVIIAQKVDKSIKQHSVTYLGRIRVESIKISIYLLQFSRTRRQ